MSGDNNLEGYGIDDINEMEIPGSNGDINVVAQFDRGNPTSGDDSSNGDWTTTKRFYIDKDTVAPEDNIIRSTEIADIGEANMGDPATLSSFINWAILNYPAERYFLIFWNHGDGWRLTREKGSYSINKGVCWDDTDEDVLYMREVKDAINQSIENQLVKFDIVGFDACLMGLLENAYMVRGTETYPTESVIFSQLNEYADGWEYDTFIQDFQDNPDLNTLDSTKYVIDRYYQRYKSYGGTTLSSVDMSYLNQVINDLDTLAANINDEWYMLYNARKSSFKTSDVYGYDSFIDLKGLLTFLKKNYYKTENADYVTQLETSLNNFIYYYKNTAGIPANGLNIYFPQDMSNPLWGDYTSTNTDLVGDTNWKIFLQNYYNGDKIVPTVPQMNSVDYFGDGEYEISWTEASDDNLNGYLLLEREFFENIFFDGAEDNDISDWNYTNFVISDSQPKTGTYSFYSGDGNNYTAVLEKNITLPSIETGERVLLKFDLLLKVEEFYDHFYVKVDNGINEEVLLDLDGSYENYETYEIDLSSYSNSSVNLIFEYRTDNSYTRGGVYIDNIDIGLYGTETEYNISSSQTQKSFLKNPVEKITYLYSVKAFDDVYNLGDSSELVSVEFGEFVPIIFYPKMDSTGNELYLLLDWSDVPEADYYQIIFSQDENFYPAEDLFIDNIVESKYYINNLEFNSDYYWKVRAVVDLETKTWSQVNHFKTKLEPVPKPTDLTVSYNENEELILEWVDNSDNEDGFELFIKEDGDEDFTLLADTPANSETYIYYPVNVGKYSFKIRAYTENNPSEFSNETMINILELYSKIEFKDNEWRKAVLYSNITGEVKDPSNIKIKIDNSEYSDEFTMGSYENGFYRSSSLFENFEFYKGLSRVHVVYNERVYDTINVYVCESSENESITFKDLNISTNSNTSNKFVIHGISKQFLPTNQMEYRTNPFVLNYYDNNQTVHISNLYGENSILMEDISGNWKYRQHSDNYFVLRKDGVFAIFHDLNNEYVIDYNKTRLFQNFPNPFVGQTEIQYYLNEAAHVKLNIYSSGGKKIKKLVDNYQEKGYYNLNWDAVNNKGKVVASGVYYYVIWVDGRKIIRKMVHLK